MAVTNYMTVNGQIRSEHRSGEAKSRDYVHDHLGNVVAVFQNDWAVAMATYDPYGEFLSSWNMSGYKFTWNGGHGYRNTGLEWSSHYVRARHYSFMDGAWTTRDPLWPNEMPYGYVEGKAVRAVDPSGTNLIGPPSPLNYEIQCNSFWNQYIHNFCNRGGDPMWCDALARQYMKKCGKSHTTPGAMCFDPIRNAVVPCKNHAQWVLPPGESIISNCCEAMKNPPPIGIRWFDENIGTGSRWDYKKISLSLYEDPGNYHYGFLAKCLGLDLTFARFAAGLNNYNNFKKRNQGEEPPVWWGRPTDYPATAHSFYGDDPNDQFRIIDGFVKASSRWKELETLCRCWPNSPSRSLGTGGGTLADPRFQQ